MLRFSYVSAQQTLKALNADAHGLTSAEASSRLIRYGENVIEKTKKTKPIGLFFAQFKDVMTLLLIAAAVISAVIAFISKDVNDLTDTVIILAIILLNAVVGMVQQYRADKAIENLKKLSTPYVAVLRDGKTLKIPAVQLTVGDIIEVNEGDLIPADCRIIDCADLKVDESALTGEADAVRKHDGVITDRKTALGNSYNMLFSSTFVVNGNATAVVTGIGRNTQIGAIADMLEGETASKTPLEKSLDKLGKIISVFVIAVATIIFMVGASVGGGILKSFMTAVAVAVAAIPEGLPAVVTIIMAMGVQRMSKQNVVIRKLKSVETLGGCTCICTDKTGTLTQNRMRVTQTRLPDGASADAMLTVMTICNRLRDGVGDPTEAALKCYAESVGFNTVFKRTGEIPFSSERKMMSVAAQCGGVERLYVKGAPDIIINKCSHILTESGSRKINDGDVAEILEQNARMSDNALRVLAFAVRDGGELKEEELTFVGLCGMIDGLKEGVKQAVEECRTAGIATVMITGDHARTAYAIAKQAGICLDESDKNKVYSGERLDAMSKSERVEAIRRGKVFARVTPAHKNLIVKIKKNAGDVVAMTGDGVNDAPPVKSSDIGIAMGKSGTDVTKSVADMVIADDNFTTIVSAVREGRRISSNVKKTICFFLSTNLAEVFAILIATIAFAHCEFLISTQLLWINLITDSFPVLALGMEKGDSDAMRRPPEQTDKAVLNKSSLIFICSSGAYIAAVTVALFACALFVYDNAVATGMTFLCVSFIELFHAFNVRSQRRSLFGGGMFDNKVLLATVVLGIAANVALCFTPLASAFGIVGLTGIQWLIVAGVSLSVLVFGEVYKLICYIISRPKRKAD